MRPKNVQIDFDLFVDLFVYAVRHADDEDIQFNRLRIGVKNKLDSMMRHELYSQYKSGSTVEERAAARQQYLDAIGLLDSFRWCEKDDLNVSHHQ